MADDLDKEVRASIAAAARDTTTFSEALLTKLGWDELLTEDPRTAVGALFEEQGRLLLTGPALDAVVLAELGGPWTWSQTRILYPIPGGSPGETDRIDGVILDEPAATVLVPGADLGQVDASACTYTAVGGLDETAGLIRVSAPRAAVVATGVTAWPAARRAARRALAHQLIGISRELLRIAVEHVQVREQFGRPLGANQAVAHKLADARVDLAAAEELTGEAWHTATDLAAAVAKGSAARAFETVAAHGQQVLGAIGYTWEHSWRHPLRRGMLLSALLGSADECEREVGEQLLAGGITRIGGITS